jgi:hypothetical protein
VNFREACKLHDAGYSGAEVADAVNGGYVDFFGWTKDQIDAKFLDDMRKICARTIPATAAIALHDCNWQGGYHTVSGAYTRYLIVRTPGSARNYHKRPNMRGFWVNKAAPSSGPAWVLVQHGRSVQATWRGGGTHSGLRGSFTGTLITHDTDSVVKGRMHVTEGALDVHGVMSFTIVSEDEFLLNYAQDNGPAATEIAFVRQQ